MTITNDERATQAEPRTNTAGSGTTICRLEPGHWLTCRTALSPGYSGQEVLKMSDTSLPGNLRYAIDGEELILLAEVRDCFGEFTADSLKKRLSNTAGPPQPTVELEAEFEADLAAEAAGLLLETSYDWTRADESTADESTADESTADESTADESTAGETDHHAEASAVAQWQSVIADPQIGGLELKAMVLSDSVEIQCKVTDITEAAFSHPATLRAVTHLLSQAHARIRFARFAVRGNEIVAISSASADRLDSELGDSVEAVVASVSLVRREVQALTDPEVAKAYLNE